ncbi:adenylate/guanylate cyclase domain-containing protein [Marimonas sp. MJW-29]|uniref:Adenylate/guanylate cyclase domain-containing protein n=1 Tax=Sulfitobacter sediminis TaxID=3234186 RepID=A0ABV3RSN5_9RHOB
MAADMVGYSRLMEADEVGTLARQKLHRIELIDPKVAAHGGRVIKLTGDGLIAEFSSVVEAVQCAVSIQTEMVAREAAEPEARRISYRIAINLGDVIFEDGDVYGDGVNIAARLEALADAGGVIVSGTAYDHLKSTVNVGYEDLGEQRVKNIRTPVRAFRVLLDPAQAGELVETAPESRPGRWPTIAASLAAALILLTVWFWQRPEFVPADPSKMAFELPDRPSIAVLAFDNISNDESNRYLADGFVESLITELARIPDLFVIARNSSFAFRDQAVDLREISQNLGVRYILEGSFQKAGDNLRINVQLVDAIKGNHIWSKRYDRPAAEFYLIQDDLIEEITLEVAGRGAGGIFRAERLRVEMVSNDDLAVIEFWEKITQTWFQFTPESNEKTKRLTLEMLDKYPNHTRGYSSLAFYHVGRIVLGYSEDPAGDANECLESAKHAVDLDSQDYMGHLASGYCYVFLNRPDERIAAFRKAYEINPNDVIVRREYAKHALVPEGKYEEAIELLKSLLRLSPGQQIGTSSDVGVIYFILEDYEKAVDYGKREAAPGIHYKGRLAASLWMNGQHEEAKMLVQEILEVAPDATSASYGGFAAHATPEAGFVRGTWLEPGRGLS